MIIIIIIIICWYLSSVTDSPLSSRVSCLNQCPWYAHYNEICQSYDTIDTYACHSRPPTTIDSHIVIVCIYDCHVMFNTHSCLVCSLIHIPRYAEPSPSSTQSTPPALYATHSLLTNQRWLSAPLDSFHHPHAIIVSSVNCRAYITFPIPWSLLSRAIPIMLHTHIYYLLPISCNTYDNGPLQLQLHSCVLCAVLW